MSLELKDLLAKAKKQVLHEQPARGLVATLEVGIFSDVLYRIMFAHLPARKSATPLQLERACVKALRHTQEFGVWAGRLADMMEKNPTCEKGE